MKIVSIIDEVQMYIFMLEEEKMKVYTNYDEIQKDLREVFEIEVSIKDIEKVYTPLIEEDELDYQIIYKNIFS